MGLAGPDPSQLQQDRKVEEGISTRKVRKEPASLLSRYHILVGGCGTVKEHLLCIGERLRFYPYMGLK